LIFNYIYTASLNIAWLREYFDPIFVLELELKDSINTASPASYLELYPEKMTVRVV
jgi:hypothetical protein